MTTVNTVQKALRLPVELNDRLEILAKQTGRTVTHFMREAISTHLEDLEDVYKAEIALQRLRDGKGRIMTSEEFWNELDG